MKKLLIKFSLGTAIAFISTAGITQQPTTSNPWPAAAQIKVGPGTVIQMEMSGDVDVKKVRPGEVFRAKLWDDLHAGGRIIIPRMTVIIGHVVEAQPHTKTDPTSKLTIAFDKALLKGGELPLHGVVERVEYSSIAISAAADAKAHSYNNSPFPGSTTNVAMPTRGEVRDTQVPPGPTNVRDTSIDVKGNPSTGTTVLSSTTKDDVKLKRFATLDVLVTQLNN
jgi:hypothetical protein